MENKKINKKQFFMKIVISIIVVLIIVIISYFILKEIGWLHLSKEQLQDKIASFGAWGPLIFIALSFLQVTFIPIPSTITIVAGSYLFGWILSFIYSLIGILLGSLFAFFLGRKIGRPFINWVVGDKETVDYYLKKLKGRSNVILFFMFLFPLFPDDALCALAGITQIRYSTFTIMQIITRIISIGATLIFMSGEIIPLNGWGITLIVIVAILGIIGFILAYKYSDKINDKLIEVTDKLFKKKPKQNLK